MDDPQPLPQRGSSQESLEMDILSLSARWEAQRTIRTGDTPGQALRKGPRPALAAIPPNVAAAAAAPNPFRLSAQRQKASRQQHQQPQPAATPTGAAPPATLSRLAVGTTGGASGSPSPYVLFRGRLSFAAEADSARKFDRPTTARKPEGGGLKRKLLISPGADISAAFPSVAKAAKQRRRSLSDAGDAWASRVAAAAGAAAEDAPPSAAAAAAGMADGSSLGNYWSDPLPLPASAQRPAAAAVEDDMLDTAASPASSDGGCCSPCAGAEGMDRCCCSPTPPPFSPLPGTLQHVLPTVENPDCGFPAITARTMRDLLAHGAAAFGLSGFVVVDCRYEYEHKGGHLPGALHLTTPDELLQLLASRPEEQWQSTAIIFHCEFSSERGPRAAKFVRNKDRETHLHDYPALSQPHVFVLQGGYKAFWRSFSEMCQGGYVPMDHPDYTHQLKACHNVVKRAWERATRTFVRKQRQRRPSYRLRQSTGAAGGSRGGAEAEELDEAAAAVDGEDMETAAAVLPALKAVTPRSCTPPPGGTGGASPALSVLSANLGGPAADLEEDVRRLQRKSQGWKDKAHKLGDVVMKQEAANKDLQRQLAVLQEAQAAALQAALAGGGEALAPADLAAMRQQLVLAQAQLQLQEEELEAARSDYEARQALLKQAAGTARREVLSMQAAHAELQGVAEQLRQQNEDLAAQLRSATRAAEAAAAAQLEEAGYASGGGGMEGWGSAGPSPAKRHPDPVLLQAMIRKQDGELSVLREDSATQQNELMRTLSALQAAHKREEDLRRQVHNLEQQLGITQDELAEKDAHLDLLRERQEGQETSLHQLRKALAAAEEQAAAAAAAAAATAAASAGTAEADAAHLANVSAEAAALRQRCWRAEHDLETLRQEAEAAYAERSSTAAEVAHLRQQLQQRDAEVAQLRQQLQQRDAEIAQLRLQVPQLRSELADMKRQLEAADSEAVAAQELLQEAQAALEQQQEDVAARLERQEQEAQAALRQQQAEAAAQLEEAQQQAASAAQEATDAAAAAQQAQQQQAELEGQLAAAAAEQKALHGQLQTAQAEQAALAGRLEAQAAEAQHALVERDEQTAAQAAQLHQQLAAAEERATALKGQLAAAEAQTADLQQQYDKLQQQAAETEAALHEQLAAAAADRNASRRQLARLQGDVCDAELLLASFLGSNSSSAASVFGTPAASPRRAAAEGDGEAAAAADVATAVQWLQQKQQQPGSPSPAASPLRAASEAGTGAAASSRLVRRVQAVLAEVQRLQAAAAQRQREGTASAGSTSAADLDREDSAADSGGQVPKPEAVEAAGAAGIPASKPLGTPGKLPLLSPVQSDSSSALIGAVHAPGGSTPTGPASAGPSRFAVSEADAEDVYPLHSVPVQMTPGAATPAHAVSLAEGEQQAEQQAEQQQQQQQQQRDNQAAVVNGKQRRKKGRHPVELFFRTAGLAGVVGAVALQVLGHMGRAR
ncbi:kinesin K39 isoform B [Chlorella sorokiniana]|uniref:protein-tyrosine-phosphatase n=1 Tax=Chlorella sorokiniana TaxID=3076 RepID=A0A2P6TRM5_CHLSO|nr:kinesin K39 isoform A [Chlorella sorokiniana]PRW56702.1 kinesin K39 isoform B [Chlorella sorokiniana]|eukprot:PRW56701.1 kinesin K39 isoform A [Chlorella sorokiniana]